MSGPKWTPWNQKPDPTLCCDWEYDPRPSRFNSGWMCCQDRPTHRLGATLVCDRHLQMRAERGDDVSEAVRIT